MKNDSNNIRILVKNDFKNSFLFILGTILGIIIFLVPISTKDGGYNLIIGIFAEEVLFYIEPLIPIALTIILSFSLIITIVYKFKRIRIISKSKILSEIYDCNNTKIIIRTIGTMLLVATVYKIGPKLLWSEETGGTMFGLLVQLSVWHLMSFYFFSLLMDFGAMNFIGVIIKNIMRPLFTLPGSSAVTCVAAWIGNGPLGVIVTNIQYKEGFYTKRESAVIATCFSIVSITFCVIVAKTLNIIDVFVPYYITICICTFICAVLLPRIYPLKKIEDTYYPLTGKTINEDDGEDGLFLKAFNEGKNKAATANLKYIVGRGNDTAIEFFLSLYPVMMAYGTILLIISIYTPIMKFIAIPMIKILEMFSIPGAEQAGPALLIGFVDMFLPAVLGSTIEFKITRFIIGCMSISQLLYMTETGIIILKNKETFKLDFLNLITLFLIRTVVSLPIVLIASKIIFR